MIAGILPALTLLTVASLAAPAAAPAPARPAVAQTPVQWEIDRSHSELTFRIRHMVSRVSGTFGDWSGSIVADPANLSAGRVEVNIRTASIDTKNERRDTHLRSDDFFDADNHPTITFRSSRVETTGPDLRIHGDLTIRGVTRPVVLEGRLLAVAGEPGRRRMGLEAETTINRLDYGVSWNRAAEVGGVVLGDDVRITIAISAVERAG